MPLERKTARELGFKVGDSFRVVVSGGLCVFGDVLTLKNDDGSTCPFFSNERRNGCDEFVSFDRLEVFVKSFETLSVGDVVIDHDGDECTVLHVLTPGIYLLSDYNHPERAGRVRTTKEMEELSYTIKQDIPDEPREVTMAEVVEKFGQNVVIRKED